VRPPKILEHEDEHEHEDDEKNRSTGFLRRPQFRPIIVHG